MFKSEKEFAYALLEGREFINSDDPNPTRHGNTYVFKNGFKTMLKGGGGYLAMDAYDWNRHNKVTEIVAPKWYENIPEQGVLCWVHNSNPKRKVRIDLIVYFDTTKQEGTGRFQSAFSDWEYAIPLTKEEVLEYIYQGAA